MSCFSKRSYPTFSLRTQISENQFQESAVERTIVLAKAIVLPKEYSGILGLRLNKFVPGPIMWNDAITHV